MQDEEDTANNRHTEENGRNTANSPQALQPHPKEEIPRDKVRPPPVQDLDIHALDVKLSSSGMRRTAENEMDFFADMTPVIPKTKSGMEKFQSELENAKKVTH